MDKSARFSLKEVQEAMAQEGKEIKYQTLYTRFRSLMRRRVIPDGTRPGSLSYDDAKALITFKARTTGRQTRKEAINTLRLNLKNDGFF